MQSFNVPFALTIAVVLGSSQAGCNSEIGTQSPDPNAIRVRKPAANPDTTASDDSELTTKRYSTLFASSGWWRSIFLQHTASTGTTGTAGAPAPSQPAPSTPTTPAAQDPAPQEPSQPATPPPTTTTSGSSASQPGSMTAQTPPPPSTTDTSGSTSGDASSFPGGFIEKTTSTAARAKLTRAQLQSLLPAAGGSFTFPAPYNTEAVRLTDASNCGGSGDCVRYVGYSYWRNINNHVGQDSMLILLGLDQRSGGAGLSLFRYGKSSGKLEALGALFQGTSLDVNATGEGIYFSATRPTTVYVALNAQLLRFDVLTKKSEVVFDASSSFGSGTYLWQHNSSDDDVVHSATLRTTDTGAVRGCLVYREDTGDMKLFAAEGDFDECQVDRSGDWVVIKDNIDGKNGEDNRIINTKTWSETDLLDENGAGGHSDFGYGILVAEDNWNSLPSAVRAWRLGQNPLSGPVVYHDPAWKTDGSNHISHTNARAGLSLSQEIACESTVSRGAYTRGSEIFCFRLDASLDVMVVAPVMTDLDAAGGGDDYSKAPKGNLDVTGRYFIWTSNTGGDRLDAFLVKVPSLLGQN